ncbi:hypothetical protein Taro_048628 [Colocasia esculenta]|uniref:Uncharacterized protein n=1 Tax=Colocasia esculenta TaxID=4460 RepID=A0A843X8L9_COLES|nr:hypothetical protein [Colocasia esculenta]
MGGGATFGGPWRGFGRSGPYNGIIAQVSNKICNELITIDVPKKGTRALLARPCIVAFRFLPFILCCFGLWRNCVAPCLVLVLVVAPCACAQFADVSGCLALPTSDIFFGFASVCVAVEQVF